MSDAELKAANHVKNGEFDLAIAVYQSIRPTSAPILIRLGRLYRDKKVDYNNALQCFTQALKMQEKVNLSSLNKAGSILSLKA